MGEIFKVRDSEVTEGLLTNGIAMTGWAKGQTGRDEEYTRNCKIKFPADPLLEEQTKKQQIQIKLDRNHFFFVVVKTDPPDLLVQFTAIEGT